MTWANAEQAKFWNAAPGGQWARHQSDLDALFQGVSELLLARAAPRPGERVLDIGCGAGASSFLFADATAPDGEVLGVDISAPLVARAEARRRRIRTDRVRFVVADAAEHPFEAGRHDLAVSRFGMMFFADPAAAIRNVAGGLRSGGRLVLAAWDGAERNPFFAVPRRIASDGLGVAPPPPDDAPGPMAFRDIGRVVGLMRDAGLRGARGEAVAVELRHPDGLDGLMRVVADIGPLARALREAQASEADRAAILDDVASAFRRFEGADGLGVPARINLFAADLA